MWLELALTHIVASPASGTGNVWDMKMWQCSQTPQDLAHHPQNLTQEVSGLWVVVAPQNPIIPLVMYMFDCLQVRWSIYEMSERCLGCGKVPRPTAKCTSFLWPSFLVDRGTTLLTRQAGICYPWVAVYELSFEGELHEYIKGVLQWASARTSVTGQELVRNAGFFIKVVAQYLLFSPQNTLTPIEATRSHGIKPPGY
ncbi:hypothetical protein C8Q72DRAFT_794841 [Fomitopsis betulina]|nr:hypothetical protein C8Q72DRAFT_794841 [Fomitopsis betulina]